MARALNATTMPMSSHFRRVEFMATTGTPASNRKIQAKPMHRNKVDPQKRLAVDCGIDLVPPGPAAKSPIEMEANYCQNAAK